jgi:hypothetical protein
MFKPLRLLLAASIALAAACGGAQSSSAPAAAAVTDPNASQASAHGLSLSRPEGWKWIQPDGTMAADTIMVLQGPFGEDALAPAIEVSRRGLDASQARRKPSHILTQLMMEVVQLFDGYEMLGTPEDIEMAGVPAARIKLKFNESLPDGGQIERGAVYYGIVQGDNIFVIRCLGDSKGSHDAEFDTILKTVSIKDGAA